MPKVFNHSPDLLRVENSLDTAEVLENVKARPSHCETCAHSLPSNRGDTVKRQWQGADMVTHASNGSISKAETGGSP